MFDKDMQKKLKEQYRVLLGDVWGSDNHMVNYCAKKAGVVFKTEKGFFCEVEKQSIKKNFCFGYSLSSYDSEDYDRANNMVRHAENSLDYFRKENLKKLNDYINFYSDTNNQLYFQNHYINQKNNILKNVVSFEYWNEPKDIFNKEFKEFTPVSNEDRKLIVDAYKKELELFTKRLETYIKRYGLSKVHAWSYWQDE